MDKNSIIDGMEDEYKVKTEAFEGPLDLLLTLIEKRKMHISDISLAEITDDYLSYIEKDKENFPMYNVAQFILIASTLVLIKSRSLLPTLTLSEEEEQDINELEAQLKEYKKFKDLSIFVEENYGKNVMFYRKLSKKITPIFSPTNELTLPNIVRSMESVIQALPKKEMIPQIIIKKIVSLKEMADSLTERINSALSLSFKDFTKDHTKKLDIVIGFLAMLELIKQGVITVSQENHFDDIHMETAETNVPRYH